MITPRKNRVTDMLSRISWELIAFIFASFENFLVIEWIVGTCTSLVSLVPTLCVGTLPGTLRVPFQACHGVIPSSDHDAERPRLPSHAERGNEETRK
jgi:hypothetical protein